jgi:hypothetical protein
VVRAVHLSELRTVLSNVYVAADQPSPAFTDPTLVPESTLIRARHVYELRDAVIVLETR